MILVILNVVKLKLSQIFVLKMLQGGFKGAIWDFCYCYIVNISMFTYQSIESLSGSASPNIDWCRDDVFL